MDFKTVGIFVVFLGLFFSFGLVLADPTGPGTLNVTDNETYAGQTTGTEWDVEGGYISTINITATVQTENWKAFVGWMNGKFTLDDSSGSTIYDWTLSTISGEVYATRNSSSISWSSIGCATQGEVEAEDTTLEQSGDDKINTTFTKDGSAIEYTVAGETITAGSCYATSTFVDNATQSGEFEETILHDGASIVYASVLEDNEDGFDENNYDFQMIVPENASETWDSSIPYYIYVELSSS